MPKARTKKVKKSWETGAYLLQDTTTRMFLLRNGGSFGVYWQWVNNIDLATRWDNPTSIHRIRHYAMSARRWSRTTHRMEEVNNNTWVIHRLVSQRVSLTPALWSDKIDGDNLYHACVVQQHLAKLQSEQESSSKETNDESVQND